MARKSTKSNSSDRGNSGGSSQPAEVVDPNNPDAKQQCLDAGGIWTSGVCITAERQCLDAGGIWTSGVCITAERQCLDAGGTWTNGVCIKD